MQISKQPCEIFHGKMENANQHLLSQQTQNFRVTTVKKPEKKVPRFTGAKGRSKDQPLTVQLKVDGWINLLTL